MSQVLFPDIADILAARLTADFGTHGETAPVRTLVPNPRPSKFVIIRRVGGPRLNLVADNPTVTLEAWGEDEAEAHDLCQLARTFVYAMRGTTTSGAAIYRIAEFAGPAFLPDPVSDQARFTCTLSIGVRGAALTDITS